MNRREFITLLGCTAALAAYGACAAAGDASGRIPQQPSPTAWAHLAAAFLRGLGEMGYIEHRSVGIEWRWAEGRYERLPALAADLVRRQVAVIVATGGLPANFAAKAATKDIPIVFSTGQDPVKTGLVASLSRPGGSITGVNLFVSQMEGKRLGLCASWFRPPL